MLDDDTEDFPPCVALVPLPVHDSSPGIERYRIVKNQNWILNNPDVQVYPSIQHIRKVLQRRAPTPHPALNKVFFSDEIPWTGSKRSPRNILHINRDYTVNDDHNADVIVSDAYVLHLNHKEPDSTLLTLLKRYQHVAALTPRDVELIIAADPLFLSRGVMSGFPGVKLRVMTKAGKPRKSPVRVKDQYSDYCAYWGAIDPRFFSTTAEVPLSTITNLLKVKTGSESYSEERIFRNFMAYPTRLHTHSDLTFSEKVDNYFNYLKLFTYEVESILSWKRINPSTHTGDRRSPIIWLKRRHLAATIEWLASFYPLMCALENIDTKELTFRDSSSRVSSWIAIAKNFHKAMYQFARALKLRAYPGFTVPLPKGLPDVRSEPASESKPLCSNPADSLCEPVCV